MAKFKLDVAWKDLDKAFDHLEREVTDIVRGITVETFQQILYRTPQYYGRMVVSYTYSINRPIFVDRSDNLGGPDEHMRWKPRDWVKISSKGGVKAVKLAGFYNVGADLRFKLGDTVYISNGVDHGEGGYAAAVESGAVALRQVNRPGNAVAKTLAYINSRYSQNVSRTAARKLKTLQITDY